MEKFEKNCINKKTDNGTTKSSLDMSKKIQILQYEDSDDEIINISLFKKTNKKKILKVISDSDSIDNSVVEIPKKNAKKIRKKY